MASHISSQRITSLEKFGYGLGDAACNVVFQLVMTFLAYFYTDVFGLEAATVGTLLLVVRAATALADPVAGALCDRTHTRRGKFRPYLVWLALPLAIVTVATFTTPNATAGVKLAYACVTYGLLMILYSGVNVPYCALGAVITNDAKERISLNGYRFLLATGGGALVTACTLPLVRQLGGGDQQLGFPLAVSVLSTAAILMFWASYRLTKERVEQQVVESSGLARDLRTLVKNDQWRIVAAMNFVLFVALVIQDGVAVYYVSWYIGRPDLIGPFVTAGMISSMIGAICASPLVGRVSKATAYSALQAVIVFLALTIYWVEAEHLVLLFALYAIQQFFTQMASPVLWSMMADTADYGEFISGRRITGLTLSGALLALKLGAALGGALLGWLLAYFEYQSQATSQSAGAVHGIALLFTIIPAAGHLLLILLASQYRLNNGRCYEIWQELNRRKSMHN